MDPIKGTVGRGKHPRWLGWISVKVRREEDGCARMYEIVEPVCEFRASDIKSTRCN